MTVPRLPLLAAVLLGCPGAPVDLPGPPPLEPVERDVAWHAVFSSDDAAAQSAAVAALVGSNVGGVSLGGAIIDGLGPTTVDRVSLALERLGPLAGTAVGIEVPGLAPDGTAPTCFDADSPLVDAALQARHAALADLLSTHESLSRVYIDPAGATAPWDMPCACETCESQEQLEQASKLAAIFGALEQATLDEGATPWWRDDLADTDADAVTWMAAARTEFRDDSTLAVRTEPVRGPDHRWATAADGLGQALSRPVGADVDLTHARFGPLQALIIDAAGLEDRLRSQRSAGVRSWFARMHGPVDAADPLRSPNLAVFQHLFSSFDGTAEGAMETWLAERYGLVASSENAAVLAAALGRTGRAAQLVTHPLGIEVADPAGFPSLATAPVDPTDWDVDWADRLAQWEAPDLPALAAIHQWVHEGDALARAARDTLAAVDSLAPADQAELAAGLDGLVWWTGAWRAAVDGVATARYLESWTDDAARAWLAADADTLDSLADSAPADASLDRDTLTALAAELRALAAGAAAADRPFPTITQVRWDFDDDLTNVRWRIEPEGSGWLQHEGDWPDYTDESDHGAGPDHNWRAWLRELPPDDRVVFRVCGGSSGYVVCSSDHALWTRP